MLCSPRESSQATGADGGDHEHGRALHGFRMGQALRRFIDDPSDQQHHRQAVHESSQRLGAYEAEGVAGRGRAARDQLGHQGQAEGGGVGDHVAGVGNQCQRVRQHAGDRLDQREQQGQAERETHRGLAAAFDDVAVAGIAVEVGVQVGGGDGLI
jgi:hypothetical protein